MGWKQILVRKKFRTTKQPTKMTVRNLVMRFRETSSVTDNPRSGRSEGPARTGEHAVRRLEESPKKITAKIILQTGFWYGTCHRTVRNLKFRPYKARGEQQLNQITRKEYDSSRNTFSGVGKFWIGRFSEMKHGSIWVLMKIARIPGYGQPLTLTRCTNKHSITLKLKFGVLFQNSATSVRSFLQKWIKCGTLWKHFRWICGASRWHWISRRIFLTRQRHFSLGAWFYGEDATKFRRLGDFQGILDSDHQTLRQHTYP